MGKEMYTNIPSKVDDLLKDVKNGKTGLKLLPPLYVHNEDGSYTDEVLKIFGK